MRIQHNIMAMNAYRNYNLNNKALSGNLEKLSSGYKINRAGDDAAGLAISEKMRAQITGLNAAQKNVKDGISLVKTAEGAMQEIQDMLNRMDYLATQSANGTYQDEVDRENLQKEVENLKTEINRIADSANFNGIKLLDGSLQEGSTARTDALVAADAAMKAAEDALAAAPNATGKAVYGEETSFEILEESANNDPNDATEGVGKKTILETDYAASAAKPGFTVNLDGVEHVFTSITDATTTDDNDKTFTITINNQKKTISEKDLADAYAEVKGVAAKVGDKADATVIAKALETKFDADGSSATKVWSDAATNGNKYTVRADEGKLVFEATDNLTTDPTRHFDVKIHGVKQGDAAAEAAVFKTGAFAAGTNDAAAATATITAKIDGNDVTFTANALNNSNVATWKTALGNATATVDGATVKLSDYFTVDGGTAGFTFTDKVVGAAGSGNSITNVAIASTAANDADKPTLAAGITKTDGRDAYKNGTTGYTNAGTEVTIQSGKPVVDQLASTTFELKAADIKDGTKVRIGDQEYTFAIGANSAYKDVENAVYVDGVEIADGATELDTAGVDKMVTKLVEVAQNNTTFTVSHQADKANPGKIGVKQLAEVKESTEMDTMEKLEKFFGISHVDADKTVAATEQAVKDATAAAEQMKADAEKQKADAEKLVDGNPLTLQIGDTSDDFNQMKVSVGDMHVKAMGTFKKDADGKTTSEIETSIFDIDIGTQKGAQDAVDVVKNAINYVSSIRGDLGAIQNRLDHTANNLSVMAENIQDAESTIRDTDVAEEMMSYVKNNILVQSAQAMLAQANQVPQGVLQLLG